MTAVAGSQKIALGEETLSGRPALKSFAGKPVILGIRPEDLEDAELAADASPDRALAGEVQLTEALGSEVMVHFTIDATAAVTDEVRELQKDAGTHEMAPDAQNQDTGSTMVGRFGARSKARKGEPVKVVRRHARTPFLRPGDGTRHLRRNERTRMKRQRLTLLGLMLALLLLVGACGSDDEEGTGGGATTEGTTTAAESVSGSISVIGVWTGPEQKSFQAVIDGFKEQQPGRDRQVHVRRRQHRHRPLDRSRGREPA